MGTFGTGPFENDDALDWLASISKAPSLRVEKSLMQFAGAGKKLDSEKAAEALASAEIVAIAFDNSRLSKALAGVFEASGIVIKDLRDIATEKNRQNAIKATENVINENCELYQLWQESGLLKPWLTSVNNTRKRPAQTKQTKKTKRSPIKKSPKKTTRSGRISGKLK